MDEVSFEMILDLAHPFNFWPFPGSKTRPEHSEVVEGLLQEFDSLIT